MIRNPPFAAEVLLPRGREDVELCLELHPARTEPPMAPDEYDGCAELLDLFAAATEAQLFSSGRPGWGKARLKILSHQNKGVTSVIRYHFASASVPAEAYLILLALLAQAHYDLVPLERVCIKPVVAVQQPITRDELLGLQSMELYRPETLPYTLEQPEQLGRKNIVALFDFQERLNSTLVGYVKDVLGMWDQLVSLGGFDFSFEESSGSPVLGRISQIGPSSMQIDWTRFQGNEFALNALIGLGASIHESGLLLVSLSIE